MSPHEAVAEFLEKITLDEVKRTVNDLASLVLSLDSRLSAAVKWKRLTFALNEDFHHWICAVSCTKKSVVVYFHYGVLLNDVYNRFIPGESYFLRKIEFSHGEPLEENVIRDYGGQAIARWEFFKKNWKSLNTAARDGKA